MLAIADVKEGDVIDIRILCKTGESGTATVNVALMDNDLFRLGYQILGSCPLNLTTFTGTLVEGTISCNRDGLLYTSIPQNGNWVAEVDGVPQETVLVGDCMIGLNLTQGTHTVRFVYRNEAFRAAALISGVSFGIFLLLALLSLRPRKKSIAPEKVKLPEQPEELAHPENEMPPFIPHETLPVEQGDPFVLESLEPEGSNDVPVEPETVETPIAPEEPQDNNPTE